MDQNDARKIIFAEKAVRVAVVQDSSVIMQKEACINKVSKLTQEAARNKAKIVLFPEAFIPAYPRGLSFGTKVGSRSEEGKQDFARYWENSIAIPSDNLHFSPIEYICFDSDARNTQTKSLKVFFVFWVSCV